jgi:DNA-binding transcriptional LysR family regulator
VLRDLDIRLLRSFVTAAEEQHFTRAAKRLYVAQQALSRDIRRLETVLGVRLFERTTRRVSLTPDGERLLGRARELLALHDVTVQELAAGQQSLLVDVLAERRTPTLVLAAARERAPMLNLVARYSGGFGAALPQLLEQRVGVAFGRAGGLGQRLPDSLACRLVRLEPLGLLLADDHPLAARKSVPIAEIRGMEIDASVGNDVAPEWVDAAVQLLRRFGAEPSPPHHHVVGAEETARHLREHGLPILAHLEGPPIPAAIIRPLTNPVPLYPWSMVYPRESRHPGLRVLQEAADALSRQAGWLTPPPKAWMPEPEATLLQATH